MDLSDKIKKILSDKNISPSIFADEIGIQRSSMSHILAGRNRPSLDIIQKIVKRFPDLGLNWILEGEDLPVTIQTEARELPRKNIVTPPPVQRNPERGKQAVPEVKKVLEEKKIERILIFYTDGSYKEFKEAS